MLTSKDSMRVKLSCSFLTKTARGVFLEMSRGVVKIDITNSPLSLGDTAQQEHELTRRTKGKKKRPAYAHTARTSQTPA